MKTRAVYGVGVDITRIARIKELINKKPYYRQRFLTGCFHPTEIEEFESKGNETVQIQYLASRFALKEAMIKASGRTDLEYPGIFLDKMRKYNPGEQSESSVEKRR